MNQDMVSKHHPDWTVVPEHDELLPNVLTNSQVTLFGQDRDLRYLWTVNPRSGFLPDDVVGKTDWDLLPKEEAAILTRIKQEVLNSGCAARKTVQTTHNGIAASFTLFVRAQRDQQDTIVGLICVATDITSYQRAVDELRFDHMVLDSIHDSVIATDPAGHITYWNQGAQNAFGYQSEEMLGRNIAMLDPDGDEAALAANLASIAVGRDHRGEWKGRRKNGTVVWLDILTTSLRDDTCGLVGFVGVGKDITERKRLEQERDQLLQQEQSARDQLQQFLAMVAHEQRQGLTIIRGHAHFLNRTASQNGFDACRDSIAAIENAGEQVQYLLEDLEDAAAVGAGRFSVLPQPMDLVDLVQTAVSMRTATSLRHQLHVETPGRVDGEWDAHRMRQLVSNLLDNAIKYSPDGGEVVVRLGSQGEDVLLAVSDDGVGIEPEQQQYLFDLFYRGKERSDIPGVGLGLYLCRAIVDAHGGSIGVESEPGRGSTFWVNLPRERPEP